MRLNPSIQYDQQTGELFRKRGRGRQIFGTVRPEAFVDLSDGAANGDATNGDATGRTRTRQTTAGRTRSRAAAGTGRT